MSSSTNTYLTPVKSVNFNISEFVGATYDPCFRKGYIETRPTIYKTGNSFYFDYSNSANSSDLKFLKRLTLLKRLKRLTLKDLKGGVT